MTDNAAEALELALWLHRVPARRAALLGRPLPDGIGQLLRVACGAPEQVAAAATLTGQPEGTVLEAVRFYLQQILFHDEADAYRVLGLRPGATHEQAREHHRLLQQWLHPDRHGPHAWESIYASRINRAWSQLRTPQSRAAYDAALPSGSRQGVEPPPSSDPRRGPQQSPAAPPIRRQASLPARNRSRSITLLVLLGCIGLLALIATRNDKPPEWRDDDGFFAAGTAPTPEPAGEVLTSGDSAVPDGSALLAAMEALVAPSALQGQGAADVATPAPEAAVLQTRAAVQLATMADTPETPPSQAVTPSRSLPVPVQVPMPVPVQAAAAPVVPFVAPPDPARGQVVAASAAPRTVPTPGGIVPRAATLPDILPMPLAVAAPTVASTFRSAPVDANARLAMARTRAVEVSRYFGDPEAIAPPLWNDVPSFQRAQGLRAELHERLGNPARLVFRLEAPQWALAAGGARLDSGYRAGRERGKLALEFTWRDEQLLVSSISLVPDA